MDLFSFLQAGQGAVRISGGGVLDSSWQDGMQQRPGRIMGAKCLVLTSGGLARCVCWSGGKWGESADKSRAEACVKTSSSTSGAARKMRPSRTTCRRAESTHVMREEALNRKNSCFERSGGQGAHPATWNPAACCRPIAKTMRTTSVCCRSRSSGLRNSKRR